MTEKRFAQDYLCDFGDDDGYLFDPELVDAMFEGLGRR